MDAEYTMPSILLCMQCPLAWTVHTWYTMHTRGTITQVTTAKARSRANEHFITWRAGTAFAYMLKHRDATWHQSTCCYMTYSDKHTDTHLHTHTRLHTHTLSHQVSGTNSSSHPDTNNHNTPSLCRTLTHSAHAMASGQWYKLRITHRGQQIQHILSLSHFDELSTHCGLRWKVGSHTDQQMQHTLCLTLVD